MNDKKHTHVAMHSIEYNDAKGNHRSIPAKSTFVAADVLDADNVKALTDSGAIRKLDRKELAEDTTATKTNTTGGTAAGSTGTAGPAKQ